MSSDVSSALTWASTLKSEKSCERAGEEATAGEVVLSLSRGREDLRMLMLFQIPLLGRLVGRSLGRSSPCRVPSCGCERRERKASLAGEGKHRNGMVKAWGVRADCTGVCYRRIGGTSGSRAWCRLRRRTPFHSGERPRRKVLAVVVLANVSTRLFVESVVVGGCLRAGTTVVAAARKGWRGSEGAAAS
jgi:hypothetical protein